MHITKTIKLKSAKVLAPAHAYRRDGTVSGIQMLEHDGYEADLTDIPPMKSGDSLTIEWTTEEDMVSSLIAQEVQLSR